MSGSSNAYGGGSRPIHRDFQVTSYLLPKSHDVSYKFHWHATGNMPVV